MGRANALLVGLAVGALIALSFSYVILADLWNATSTAAGAATSPTLSTSPSRSASAVAAATPVPEPGAPTPPADEPPTPSAPTDDPAPPSQRNPLDLRLDSVAPNAAFGVAVWDRAASELVVDHHADQVFTSASLVKLLIALEALEHASPDTAQIRRMLSASDDAIASALWIRHGGPSIVTNWARRLQLADTHAPEAPGRWGDTLTSARDVVLVYRYILEQAGESTRKLILNALTDFSGVGSDGFNQRFGLATAAGSGPVAVKQGWACCRPDRVLHTSGVVGPNERFIVVVLSSRVKSSSWASASEEVTEMVAALRPVLVENR